MFSSISAALSQGQWVAGTVVFWSAYYVISYENAGKGVYATQ